MNFFKEQPNQQEEKSLLSSLKLYNMTLDLDPNEPTGNFKKAETLVKLFKLTNNDFNKKLYKQQALSCFSRAIESAPENTIYLADRAQFYSEINEFDLAAQDVKKIRELPPNANNLLNRYIQKIVDKIESQVLSASPK